MPSKETQMLAVGKVESEYEETDYFGEEVNSHSRQVTLVPLYLQTLGSSLGNISIDDIYPILINSQKGCVSDKLLPYALRWQVGEIVSPWETNIDQFSVFSEIDHSTKEYICNNSLEAGMNWLKNKVPFYFPNSHFEIDSFKNENDEGLILRVYTNTNVELFSRIRFIVMKNMLKEGYKKLYDSLCISQWGGKENGWAEFFQYRAISL